MRLDTKLQAQILAGNSLGIKLNADGTVAEFGNGWGKSPYPPPGYMPWNVFDVGNGDTYGFYWPIGNESFPPLVCTTMHDSADLFPVASSFDRAVRLLSTTEFVNAGEINDVASEFGIDLAALPEIERDETVRFWGRRAKDLHAIDDCSPSVLLAMAEISRNSGDLHSAAKYAEQSVSVLPEYADGWHMLSQLHRQSKNMDAFIDAAIRALTAPCAFGTFQRRKVLESLQRLPDSLFSQSNDPIWIRSGAFTMAQGVYESPDLQLLRDAIDEYHGINQHIRAIYLRIVSGEWMKTQTVSFQERSKWSWDEYRADLRQDHVRAGLTSRLCVL